jgi:hypothetical protein
VVVPAGPRRRLLAQPQHRALPPLLARKKGELVRELCEPAKHGRVCIDDLCRSNPDNTLCGFDQSEYEEMTREYIDDPPDHQTGPCMQHGRMNCFDCNEEL